MTDPQFPPPSPSGPSSNGQTPPVPQAPGQAAPPYSTMPPAQYPSPPGAYAAPVGGYAAPQGAYQAPQRAEPQSATLGVVAFVLSIVAAVVAPIIGGIAGYQIGHGLPTVMEHIDTTTSDLSFLSPVRDQVLMGEIGFWVGTLAGLAAIVLGIIAIAKRRGRVWGIVALIVAALAPMIFFFVLSITLGVGASTGAVMYGA
ncbi:MAG: hypothetical protein ACTH2E_01445 [Microbacterium sp.]|uniref:DUF4064 domain-containing protein n=1 Tax=Microbacterium gubbeenense TaxID=159896 RepID=UPI003F96C071